MKRKDDFKKWDKLGILIVYSHPSLILTLSSLFLPNPPLPPSPLQLIYDLGVSFRVIMWVWSGMAWMVFLNCLLNWPGESFPAPEDIRYTSV